jgi:hypothetical protein
MRSPPPFLHNSSLLHNRHNLCRRASREAHIEPELTFGFLAASLPVPPVLIKHVSKGSCRLWMTQTALSQKMQSPARLSPTRTGDVYGRPQKDGGILKEVKTKIEFIQVDVSGARADEEALAGQKWERDGAAWRRESWTEEDRIGRTSTIDAPRVWS